MERQKGRRRFLKNIFTFLAFSAGTTLSFKNNKYINIEDSGPINIGPSEAQAAADSVSGLKKITIEEYFTTESLLDYLRSRVRAGALYDSLFDYSPDSMLLAGGGILSEERLKDMDEAGIDMQVISALPWHEGLVDPAEGTAMAKRTNDEIYEITRKYPKRYAGFAGLACHNPEGAAKELERAVKELGLKGAMLYSHIQGEYLDNQKFWPVFEKAQELDVPIYIHPKGPPPNMIGPYLDYNLWGASWGFAADVGIHSMRLISSGLFDKYPKLKIIVGHAGEGLPYWLSRMGMGGGGQAQGRGGGPSQGQEGAPSQGQEGEPSQVQTGSIPRSPSGTKIPRALCKKSPGEYVKENFYVTTSGMFWEPVLMFLHTVLGPDRILFAVDYPAGNNIEGVKSIESLTISNEDKNKIFHLNAERLLKL